MKTAPRLVLSALLLVGAGYALAKEPPLAVVSAVDLKRYSGMWYEVARLPNRFQQQCMADVTADYQLRDDGRLSVTNACRLADGSIDRAEGEARIASDQGSNAKLEVRFAPAWLGWLPLVWGDYWIIELAPDYSYSVVGTQSRKYFWVLARNPSLDEAALTAILLRASKRGFDTTAIVRTLHQ